LRPMTAVLSPVARTYASSTIDTEQKNSASFEREDGASWGSGRGLEIEARTGGAARHAGQGAE